MGNDLVSTLHLLRSAAYSTQTSTREPQVIKVGASNTSTPLSFNSYSQIDILLVYSPSQKAVPHMWLVDNVLYPDARYRHRAPNERQLITTEACCPPLGSRPLSLQLSSTISIQDLPYANVAQHSHELAGRLMGQVLLFWNHFMRGHCSVRCHTLCSWQAGLILPTCPTHNLYTGLTLPHSSKLLLFSCPLT